jgi:hypothetical protein
MRRYSEAEPERFVPCTEHVVLQCGCGERLVLLGLEEDWYSEGRTTFECECGGRITLADRVEEEGPYVADPIHRLRATYYDR